jgi:hypothetical protein
MDPCRIPGTQKRLPHSMEGAFLSGLRSGGSYCIHKEDQAAKFFRRKRGWHKNRLHFY